MRGRRRQGEQEIRPDSRIGKGDRPGRGTAPDPKTSGQYFLLDGHLRIEALKDLGVTEVECLVSTDDEGCTYNKRILIFAKALLAATLESLPVKPRRKGGDAAVSSEQIARMERELASLQT